MKTKDYMDNISSLGIMLGLDTIKELLRRLGNPQDSLSFVHIAGTNGKGSVVAYLSSILMKSGYKTGIFTSPAVFEPLEIIRVGRRNISRADYDRLVLEVKNIADEMVADGLNRPTSFETQTAVAFLYYKEKNCDVVVLECGLGGIEDATNVVSTTVLSVITSISKDHTAILGRTLSEIAEKKAGIIKPGIPVVTSVSDDEALKVIERVAEDNGSDISVLDSDCIQVLSDKFENIRFNFLPDDTEYTISMSGAHQVENATLAIIAANTLAKNPDFTNIRKNSIINGLKSAVNPGRLTAISKSPLVIIDGAHNPSAAMVLRSSIDRYFKDRRIIMIMGVFADKDYETLCRIMLDRAEAVITVQTPDNERALPAIELAKCALKYNKNTTVATSVEEALEMSMLLAENKDVILAFGSLSYLGRLKKVAERINF